MSGRVIVLRADAAALPLPDASVDAVVCDPPYGLEFMGREWDTFTPSKARIRTRADGRTNPAEGKSLVSAPESYTAGQPFQAWCFAWASECLRVLKPGGYMLAFGGSRTWHRLACAVEDAGFDIRDSVAELTGQDAPGLMWVYGAGFPKSADVARAVDMKVCPLAGRHFMRQVPRNPKPGDHVCPESEEGKPWRGWGTALKPAWEPIIVARKSLAGTVAANVVKHGTGALDIDGCRIEGGMRPARSHEASASGLTGGIDTYGSFTVGGSVAVGETGEGRWPPNVLLTHSADCEPLGTREVSSDGHHPAARGRSGYESRLSGQAGLAERESGTETVDAWACAPGCPVAELDLQSGVTRSSPGGSMQRELTSRGYKGGGIGQRTSADHDLVEGVTKPGGGGASRFFPAFRWQAKAPASERPRIPRKVMRLRADLTEEQRAHVLAELRKAGVDVA
jgi:hypothetical protein